MSRLFVFFLIGLFSSTPVWAFSALVMGVNLDITQPPYSFPCALVQNNVVFCDDTYKIADQKCADNIQFKSLGAQSVEVSCLTSKGQKVILGRASGELTVDTTQDAFGFVDFELDARVNLQQVPGVNRYILNFK